MSALLLFSAQRFELCLTRSPERCYVSISRKTQPPLHYKAPRLEDWANTSFSGALGDRLRMGQTRGFAVHEACVHIGASGNCIT